MKVLAVEPERATIVLSMEEFGLLMNALWQELGYSEPRKVPLEDDLRTGYEALQVQLGSVIARMDAAGSAS
ncbi:MAG TPA: hypothetical protein VF344_09315 [Candidatus Limnocylindrales bacterium]